MKEYKKLILEIFYCDQADIVTSSMNANDNLGEDIDWDEEG